MKTGTKRFVFMMAGLFLAGAAYSATSSLVYSSPTGLVYSTYANQNQVNAVNKIPDFSKAGYKGGGVTIPFVPAKVTVSPSGGDDTAAIQNAINQVSAMPVDPNGFRGAVLLEAGEYTVSSTLTISKSGVVVRGAGSQENGGTRITYTATKQSDVFSISGGSGPSEIGGTRVDIADSFVPVGATSLTVANASGFSPGDTIIVQMTVNQDWLDDMSDMSQYGWTPGSYQLTWRRVVTAVNGNQITIDSPIVQTIEDQYGGGDVYKYSANLLENIGVEAIRFVSTYKHIIDEDHGRFAVKINTLQNGWVRQVTAKHFTQGAVSIDSNSQFITVEDCAALDHISLISGGRRYSFSIDDSQYLLVQRCLTREGRHDYVSGSRTPGPNAFVDCRADNTHADIGPHHRYATGQIYDNIMGGAMGAYNHRSGGSGHGWAGAQILYWNCDASTLKVDAPNGAMNWCIGSIGEKVPDGGGEPYGIWDSEGIPVTPRSLYYTQLNERLGTNALNSVVLPKQKTGTIWDDLHEWGGDGLFLDELIVLADVETVPAVGESLELRGIVRNLTMLDNGATSTWRKVYGPGTATFADDSALETTVSFSQNGSYLLELSVDDGSSVLRGAVIVQAGTGGADTTAPAAPTGLTATDSESSVSLNWPDSGETDLAGYDVFRSAVSGEIGVALAYGLTSSDYVDQTAEKGVLYYYTVRAVDGNSNVSALSDEATAMVNALPTVEFTEPVDGYVFNDGDNITVKVDAADKGGTITVVELFVDGQSVGQDTTAPYEWSGQSLLQNMAVGSYVLKAVTVDDKGTSATNSITISVAVDVTAPATPAGLFAIANSEWVSLDWTDNTEHDLAGYNVYRSTVPGSYGAPLTTVTGSSYDDLGLTGGTPYYYKVTATDTNGFESAASSEVVVTPKTVPPGMILFGTNNDGMGGFTHTAANSTQIWTTRISSVQYRNEHTDQSNASFLKAYTLDRSDGQSYTIEGVITLTDGYPEDNNRVGLYLFGDSAQIPGDTEAGALYFHFNFEGADFILMEGIQRNFITSETHGRSKDYTWFQEETIKISVDITFNGSDIDISATLTDGRGDSTTLTASVPAADYTGDYFGFATRSRTRDFGAEPPTFKSAPFTMDYRSFWVSESDDTSPAAPTGLAAVAGNGLVSLDWDDNTEGDVDTYTVYRSTTSGSYEDALVSGLSASEYTDYTADNGVTYYYKITASDYHANESAKSAEVSATPAASLDTTPPTAPTGLSATAGEGLVLLDWDNNSETDLDSYSVYRSTTSGSYSAALDTNVSLSEYTDSTAVNGTTYYYTVTAVDAVGNESVKSSENSATPVGAPDTTPPAAPTGLSVSTIANGGALALNWNDNGEGDWASYSLYRSTTSGSYGGAMVTGLSSSAYVDDSVTNGTTYYYVVTAVDSSDNESAQSNEDSATPEEVTGFSDVTLFGSNNDGLGGFTQSTGATVNETWSTETNSVHYRNQDASTQNSSLLKAFTLDRSNGKSYTIEGVVHLTDGYADDNNRVGIYLFGDTNSIPNENEAGAIGIIFNTDDSSAAGSPGNNAQDNLNIRVGIDSSGFSTVLRNQTVPYAQDLFGTEVTLRADIVYTNVSGTDSIVITAYLIEESGPETAIIGTNSVTVAAADYTGDWFGFVTRARARNYPTDPTPTPEEKSSPWVMDYRSFSVTDNALPAPPDGYQEWLLGYGVEDTEENFYEYVMASDPTDGLTPTNMPTLTKGGSGLLYIHPQRSDDTTLTYTVETTTNLLDSTSWTNLGYTVIGTNVTGEELDFVTNDVDTADNEKFIRLKIEK